MTAVCHTDNLELVKGLGADRVVDYTAEDFTKDEQTYDVVLDAVGKSSFGRCRRLLKPGGLYLSTDLGPLSQNPFLALVTPLCRRPEGQVPDPEAAPGDDAPTSRGCSPRARSGRSSTGATGWSEIVEAYR